MSDIPTKTYPPAFLQRMIADMEARIEQSNRRDRYIGAVRSLRDTLAYLREGQTVSTKQMRDSVVELLDALLDMETDGGTR